MATQISLKRILYATDFLESSRLALDYAVALAARYQATIVMVHAVELSEAAEVAEAETRLPSVSRKMAISRLEALANGVRRLGIEVQTHVEEGFPADIVTNACDYHHADLLVIGIHGVHRGIDHLVVGSNTERILLSTTCPVLTIGAHVLAGVDLDLHFPEILYFSDLSPEAVAAAPYAAFFGREFNAPIEVCQLLPEDADPNDHSTRDLINQYCADIKSALGETRSDWCLPSVQLQRGMAVTQLIERAQTQHAGLIVLGIHTETHFGRHLHTSYAYRLLARATCPVLSVRIPYTASK
ncbi:MAG: universal stress protein [Acidobacteria bacterium]|nr:universal stress protein [Acidobacteriota bacterium]